ncbi:aminopeptidase P family N-terminal domain-containing protein [Bradyrhizobium sp. USDA 223]|uniref:aminopeptidase P family N-terminal domain-containing protein n=1 Tax=Bradyrhizobium sp. USDA 223 TaxID=3156306 RepID=UPI0038365CB1
MPAFHQQEYRDRTVGLRQQMAEGGMDALPLMNASNLNYLTGYEGPSDYLPQFILVCPSEEDACPVLREMDAACAPASSYPPNSHMPSYPEKYIGSKYIGSNKRAQWQPIDDLIRERTKVSRIGVELTANIYVVNAHTAPSTSLDLPKSIDAGGRISNLKLRKSPGELGYMEQAEKIVDRAMQLGQLQISLDARECDIAAAVTHALCAGKPEAPGGASRILPTMSIRRPVTAPHSKWSDGCYAMDCQTNCELGAFRHRYCCAFPETILGCAVRSAAVHAPCLLATCETVRPRATCGDVAEHSGAPSNAVVCAKNRAHRLFLGHRLERRWGDCRNGHTRYRATMTFHLISGKRTMAMSSPRPPGSTRAAQRR